MGDGDASPVKTLIVVIIVVFVIVMVALTAGGFFKNSVFPWIDNIGFTSDNTTVEFLEDINLTYPGEIEFKIVGDEDDISFRYESDKDSDGKDLGWRWYKKPSRDFWGGDGYVNPAVWFIRDEKFWLDASIRVNAYFKDLDLDCVHLDGSKYGTSHFYYDDLLKTVVATNTKVLMLYPSRSSSNISDSSGGRYIDFTDTQTTDGLKLSFTGEKTIVEQTNKGIRLERFNNINTQKKVLGYLKPATSQELEIYIPVQ